MLAHVDFSFCIIVSSFVLKYVHENPLKTVIEWVIQNWVSKFWIHGTFSQIGSSMKRYKTFFPIKALHKSASEAFVRSNFKL